MVGLGEAMLDAVALAGAAEDAADPGVKDALVPINELGAIVCQDGMDRVGQRCKDERVRCGIASFSAAKTSSSGSRACTRSATMAASSIGESTVLRRSFGPIGMSSTDRRCRHFRTVFSLIP